MLKKIFWLVLVLFVVGNLAAGVGALMLFAPNTPDFEGRRSIKIPPRSSFEAVLDTLEAGGVLASRSRFEQVALVTGWRNQIKAGHYAFESGASNYALLNTLRKGLQTHIRLIIPPGTRPEVVAAIAGRDMAFSSEDFLNALRDPALAASLETDTLHLFGYLLPETYFFYWLTDAETVIARIKKEFDTFLTADMRQQMAKQGLTVADVASLAGIVEWETSVEEEKARVAGVYLNRLQRGWPLQADPTVQFAILQYEGKKRRLFNRDYELIHPYNTYLKTGLPPGPITNASPSSLRAVVFAETHDYMYFVAKPGGGHSFNTTLAGHNRDAAIFHRYMAQQRNQ